MTQQFVVRSMSTTDYVPGGQGHPAQQPQPYHIYLMPAAQRARAYWGGEHCAQLFGSEADAHAEAERAGIARFQVAPLGADALGLPAYWER